MRSKEKTVAVIDVGSNSIKLLVACGGAGRGVETLYSETIETRISGGMNGTRPKLSEEAFTSGCNTIVELYTRALAYQPEHFRIVATSAVRDAVNGEDFRRAVRDATGLEMLVLDGAEEARWIGRGLACDPKVAALNRFIQIDLGGGSLELIHFHAGDLETSRSLPLGAVRLAEKFLPNRSLPLSEHEEAAIRQHTEEIVNACGFSFTPHNTPMIGTGGAFAVARSMLAAEAGLDFQTSPRELSAAALSALKDRLKKMPLEERLKTAGLPPARADILPVALITIECVLAIARRETVTHSLYNLRYGIAADLL
ncbi:MAG: Ppx/GppA phosphatase family protein [Opitutales bacterium]